MNQLPTRRSCAVPQIAALNECGRGQGEAQTSAIPIGIARIWYAARRQWRDVMRSYLRDSKKLECSSQREGIAHRLAACGVVEDAPALRPACLRQPKPRRELPKKLVLVT